ncbi:MAG: acetyl-CoA carboxylase biotin carboxyl carrier protein [Christensenellales bacterium]|jgi:acetyl-CoA carboxylase biotin carboxyl carrier protein
MNIEDIFRIMDKAEASSFSEVDVTTDCFSLRLKKGSGIADISAEALSGQIVEAKAAAKDSAAKGKEQRPSDKDIIQSPISGVFYVAEEPGAEPFVRAGHKVNAGDTLCIIEAMKMMNEVSAPKDGVIAEVCKLDGDSVSAGEALFVYAGE